MRFFADGPSIPDELLTARDEGRVVLFCGAGVSKARAGLPDFIDLAEKVIRSFRVPHDSAAFTLLKEIRQLNLKSDCKGLISVDRIFGLLEREFDAHQIEMKVAEILKPNQDVNVSCHRILIDLATSPEGKIRVVTTNFDRLFDICEEGINAWCPPKLPDPFRNDEMDGIIYLHGCTKRDYSCPEGEGFILSSSEFGKAYLAEGWATSFVRDVVDLYTIVFIGYSADDPPIQYLLEALHKGGKKIAKIYAFHAGSKDEGIAQWAHKGVLPISYVDVDNHKILWETLEAWAKRALDPERWIESVVEMAKRGPEKLLPHERGQVAHVVSTTYGAEVFSKSNPSPPATWLFVFDPNRRYGKARDNYPGNQYSNSDPLSIYGLDTDTSTIKTIDEYEISHNQPRNAWNAFAANRVDHYNLQDYHYPSIIGPWSINPAHIPTRLSHIGFWIGEVSNQPETVWWAAGQQGLHPDIQYMIKRKLTNKTKDSIVVNKAWEYLFDKWKNKRNDIYSELHVFILELRAFGWNKTSVKKLADVFRPALKISPNFWRKTRETELKSEIELNDLLDIEIKYHDFSEMVDIPDEWVADVLCELRNNLVYLIDLDIKMNKYYMTMMNPLNVEYADNANIPGYISGLSKYVHFFALLYERLVSIDVIKAQHEYLSWPSSGETVFCRLKIWVCGKKEVVSAKEVGYIITSLSDEVFWDPFHQSDILVVLAKRWADLFVKKRKKIENRLVKGPLIREDEEDIEYNIRKAKTSLNRLVWLMNNGCEFTFEIKKEILRLRAIAPDWKPEFATSAVEPIMKQGAGWIKKDTEYSLLLQVPISAILSRALELSGRTDDYLVERDPFAGLSGGRPFRAFRALMHAARMNEYPEWAWKIFLRSDNRKSDTLKFIVVIAERLSRCHDVIIANLIHHISDWFLNISELLGQVPNSFDKLFEKIVNVIRLNPHLGTTTITRRYAEHDWSMEATKAPVGKIMQALLNDPSINKKNAENGLPTKWIKQVDELRSLNGDLYRHAIVIMSRQLNWLDRIDSDWTDVHLLYILKENQEDDKNAFWVGFLSSQRVPDQKLYIKLKAELIGVVKENRPAYTVYRRVLAGMLLAGWNTKSKELNERLITNDEMSLMLLQGGENFRNHCLSQITGWVNNIDNAANESWSEVLLEFLQNVWPRQKSVKTPATTSALCDIAFSCQKMFPGIVEIIIPFLTQINRDRFMLKTYQEIHNDFSYLYPQQMLSLIYTVLPDDVAEWPYGIEITLQRISMGDSILKSDKRFIELKRKWDSR
jgi:hypothetical protein